MLDAEAKQLTVVAMDRNAPFLFRDLAASLHSEDARHDPGNVVILGSKLMDP
jgi:hypothetical protein